MTRGLLGSIGDSERAELERSWDGLCAQAEAFGALSHMASNSPLVGEALGGAAALDSASRHLAAGYWTRYGATLASGGGCAEALDEFAAERLGGREASEGELGYILFGFSKQIGDVSEEVSVCAKMALGDIERARRELERASKLAREAVG